MGWFQNGTHQVKRNLQVTTKMVENTDLEKNGIEVESLHFKEILLMVMKK